MVASSGVVELSCLRTAHRRRLALEEMRTASALLWQDIGTVDARRAKAVPEGRNAARCCGFALIGEDTIDLRTPIRIPHHRSAFATTISPRTRNDRQHCLQIGLRLRNYTFRPKRLDPRLPGRDGMIFLHLQIQASIFGLDKLTIVISVTTFQTWLQTR